MEKVQQQQRQGERVSVWSVERVEGVKGGSGAGRAEARGRV